MLNPNAKKWVEALRSGEYKQCKERLTDGTAFCCLGVAAFISPVPPQEWRVKVALPESIMEWLGLEGTEGEYFNGTKLTALSALNDYDGKTFAEIADLIESEPEGLFV